MTGDEMLARLERIDLTELTAFALELKEVEVIRLQQGQLSSGFDAAGKRLARYRSGDYAEQKNRQNPAPGFGNPDLNLTGAFYRGMFLTTTGEQYTLLSTDPKTEALVAKYGELVFGFTEDNKVVVWNDLLQPVVVQSISQSTGLPVR